MVGRQQVEVLMEVVAMVGLVPMQVLVVKVTVDDMG